VPGFPLSSTCFRPHSPIIRRSKLYMQPVVLSPFWSCLCRVAVEFFLNGHTTKTPAEGESTTGCMYNLDLLMMGLWGLKHVQERGNPDTVYRRKRIVYRVGNKDKINYVCMCYTVLWHGSLACSDSKLIPKPQVLDTWQYWLDMGFTTRERYTKLWTCIHAPDWFHNCRLLICMLQTAMILYVTLKCICIIQ
jgi:hypothetical protein